MDKKWIIYLCSLCFIVVKSFFNSLKWYCHVDAKRLIGRRFSDPLVQSDINLWPFKIIEGPGDKPMIIVDYKGKKKHFSAEEISSMVLRMMREIAEAYLGTTVKNATGCAFI